jgi:hypothetical protein
LGGATLAQKFQTRREVETRKFAAEQDRKADERAIRDRKAQRLRENYAALLLTVMERELAAEAWRWLPADFKSKSSGTRCLSSYTMRPHRSPLSASTRRSSGDNLSRESEQFEIGLDNSLRAVVFP